MGPARGSMNESLSPARAPGTPSLREPRRHPGGTVPANRLLPGQLRRPPHLDDRAGARPHRPTASCYHTCPQDFFTRGIDPFKRDDYSYCSFKVCATLPSSLRPLISTGLVPAEMNSFGVGNHGGPTVCARLDALFFSGRHVCAGSPGHQKERSDLTRIVHRSYPESSRHGVVATERRRARRSGGSDQALCRGVRSSAVFADCSERAALEFRRTAGSTPVGPPKRWSVEGVSDCEKVRFIRMSGRFVRSDSCGHRLPDESRFIRDCAAVLTPTAPSGRPGHRSPVGRPDIARGAGGARARSLGPGLP